VGLIANAVELSAGTGGEVEFMLYAGSYNANRMYIMLIGMSGMSPGTALPGGYQTLPLNFDLLTEIGIVLLNTPVFNNFMSLLDVNGFAKATFNTCEPLLPGLVGSKFSFAYALNNPWDFASGAKNVEIVN